MKKVLHNFSIGIVMGMIVSSAVDARTLDEFADQWMDNANVTSPTSWQSQSGRSGVAFGGISSRSPVVDFPDVVTFTPPRMDAGCGGIDLYAGGFSFINADQIVAQLRAIGQNAQSLVYMMGIKLLSASLEDEISTIQGWAAKFNDFQMDSCKAAEGLLAGGANLLGKTDSACMMERMNTYGEDWDVAKQRCGSDGQAEATEVAMGQNVNKHGFIRGNLTWHILMEDSLFRNSLEFSEWIMNIYGTVLIEKENPADAGSGKITKIVLGTGTVVESTKMALWKRVMLEGGTETLTGTFCDTPAAQKTGCDQVTENATRTFTLTGIKTKIDRLFTGIMTKIRTDSPFDADETAIMSYGELPIYRILTAMAASQVITDTSPQLQELSTQLANYIVSDGLANVGSGISDIAYRLPNGMATDEKTRDWLDRVNKISSDFIAGREKIEKKLIDKAIANEKAIAFEKDIVSRLAPDMFSRVMYR